MGTSLLSLVDFAKSSGDVEGINQAPVSLKVDQTLGFYWYRLCSSCYLKERLETGNSLSYQFTKERNRKRVGNKNTGYCLKQRISDIFQFCLMKPKPAERRRQLHSRNLFQ